MKQNWSDAAAHYDAVIVGAGIVGAATAWRLQQIRPSWRLAILEKESDCAKHQSGRNSGVIHAGVYYTPGSLKARLCVEGNRRTKEFCKDFGIPFNECGKLLVATDEGQLKGLAQLEGRAQANGLTVETLNATQLQSREPNIKGLGALFVPASGIVDYAEICRELLRQFREAGGEVLYDHEVLDVLEDGSDEIADANSYEGAAEEPRVTIRCHTNKQLSCRQFIACTGIQSDRMVQSLGLECSFRMMPFRGEYFQLTSQHQHVIQHLIYPVPDPNMPFLGVHLTRMIDGSITVGPNAVLALGREAYGKTQWSLRDLASMASFTGSYRLLARYWRAGLGELCDSLFKAAYLRRVQEYCPGLSLEDLLPYRPGIRAQAVDRQGNMIDDFLFARSSNCLVVCNAPSPAATSALPIADHILTELGLLEKEA